MLIVVDDVHGNFGVDEEVIFDVIDSFFSISYTLKKYYLLLSIVPSLAANVAENSILFAAYGVCQTFVARGLGVSKTEDLSTG